ncbi:unnamed protein product, partial [Mesorhabditis spiculigera]
MWLGWEASTLFFTPDVRSCDLWRIGEICFINNDAFRSVMVDLSVDNELSYTKSAYIRDLVKADETGKLRRFLMGFRFWALNAGLFKQNPNEPQGHHLNSYNIYLLAVHFLISEKLIAPLRPSQTPKYVGNWRVDYEQPQVNLVGQSLYEMFRRLFTHVCRLDFSEPIVLHELMDGNANFREKNPDFAWTDIKIEDPIERSHNVAQNVSKKDFSRMRDKMVKALSAIKKHPGSFYYLCKSEEASRPASPVELPECAAKCDFELGDLSPDQFEHGIMRILTEVLQMDPDDQPAKRHRGAVHVDLSLGRFLVKQRQWLKRRDHMVAIRKEHRDNGQPLPSGYQMQREITRRISRAEGQRAGFWVSISGKFHGGKAYLFFNRDGDAGQGFVKEDIPFLAQFLQHSLPKLMAEVRADEAAPEPMEE